MSELRELTDRDIERLLAGDALERADLTEVASHLRNLRAFSARAPGVEVANRHVVAAASAARAASGDAVLEGAASPAPARRGFLERTRLAVARLATGAVALSGATAGLAYAGVDLPGSAAEQAFDKVGIELPNQAPDTEAADVADRVHAVIEAWPQQERGCAFGQAVAAAARDDDVQTCRSDASKAGAEAAKGKAEGKAKGPEKARGGRATGTAKSARGRAEAAERSDGPAAPEQSSGGRATAEERSSSAGTTGEEHSSAGRAAAEEKSGGGQANKPENTGKP
ncbi:MAG TPA: hypothetical protein VM638_05830 [Actinomycetota bacterium]|nr:hypothetical protein [Actinomycetota bacterium]